MDCPYTSGRDNSMNTDIIPNGDYPPHAFAQQVLKDMALVKKPDPDVWTLRQLYEKHPEWLDLPLGVYSPDGSIDFVGAAGSVYQSEYGGSNEEHSSDYPAGTKILIFSAN